jgi:hypothetical protein
MLTQVTQNITDLLIKSKDWSLRYLVEGGIRLDIWLGNNKCVQNDDILKKKWEIDIKVDLRKL